MSFFDQSEGQRGNRGEEKKSNRKELESKYRGLTGAFAFAYI